MIDAESLCGKRAGISPEHRGRGAICVVVQTVDAVQDDDDAASSALGGCNSPGMDFPLLAIVMVSGTSISSLV